MGYYVILFVNYLINIIGLLLLVYVILSYFLSPFHPVREALGRIIDPMLNPIRRMLPPIAGLDFSPIVLWLVLRLVGMLLGSLVASL